MNPNIMGMLQQLKANPMQFIGRRFNIPMNMAGDPGAIVNHLLQTGQISQEQVNRAYQMAQSFR